MKKVKCINNAKIVLRSGEIYEVAAEFPENDNIDEPGIGYTLKNVMHPDFKYAASRFEIVEDFTVDQSVYNLIDFFKAVNKLNFTNACIGSVIDAKAVWGSTHTNYDAAYAITTHRNASGTIFHHKLVFINNTWLVLPEIRTGSYTSMVNKQHVKAENNHINDTIAFIEKIITTNPNNTKNRINELNNLIITLQNDLKNAQNELNTLQEAI